jgi:hypothetical protein
VKKALSVLFLLALVAVSLLALPPVRDELRWRRASSRDHAADYREYIQAFPSGHHAAAARLREDDRSWSEAAATGKTRAVEAYLRSHERGRHVARARLHLEDLRWREAVALDTVDGFETYLKRFPAGRYRSQARNAIDLLTWRGTEKANRIFDYRQYLEQYPEGRFAGEAQSRIESLRQDDAPYQAALTEGTPEALQRFFDGYPGHRRIPDARAAAEDMEGRDIVDLLQEDKIEVETSGSGIEDLSLRLRRRVPHPITVRIPVGSFFASRSSAAQSMVATSEATITLRDGDWVDLLVDVACANMPLDIPDDEDTFTIRRSPSQQQLAQLMPVLEKSGTGSAVRQAAVWIVTDDATYDDLGTLVSRSAVMSYGGTRVINEYETAMAMKICSEAGIDITRKSIWADREQILEGLEDEELKAWLKTRSRRRGG